MPWYWSDDVASVLAATGRVDPEIAETMQTVLVAYRSDEESIETAAIELAEEGEVPLAA